MAGKSEAWGDTLCALIFVSSGLVWSRVVWWRVARGGRGIGRAAESPGRWPIWRQGL